MKSNHRKLTDLLLPLLRIVGARKSSVNFTVQWRLDLGIEFFIVCKANSKGNVVYMHGTKRDHIHTETSKRTANTLREASSSSPDLGERDVLSGRAYNSGIEKKMGNNYEE